MTIGIVAHLDIQADKTQDFEQDFKILMQIVADQEPGNLLYALHKQRGDNNTYMVMERYEDQAAVDAHGKSDEFKAQSAKLGAYLAGAPTVNLYDLC